MKFFLGLEQKRHIIFDSNSISKIVIDRPFFSHLFILKALAPFVDIHYTSQELAELFETQYTLIPETLTFFKVDEGEQLRRFYNRGQLVCPHALLNEGFKRKYHALYERLNEEIGQKYVSFLDSTHLTRDEVIARSVCNISQTEAIDLNRIKTAIVRVLRT